MRRLMTLALALLMAAGSDAPALAHPHVWTTMRSMILFTPAGLVRGVRVSWTFDEAYTKFAVDGLDANGDGSYSSDELAPLTALNLQSLKTYGYFVFFRKNGDVVKIGDAADPAQAYAHGRLTLQFTLPLLQPLDPRKDEVKLKVYDPEFFIDFEYAKKDPVAVSGAMPANCKTVLTAIQSDGNLNQTRLMLASKGIDWKPDNNEDFGGMFAQAILMACAP